MFAYCLNNPVRYADFSGQIAEDVTDEESEEEEQKTRLVGAGIQINIDAGSLTIGLEIILYWDPTVCGEGNWMIAIYTYGGVSVETYDAWLASIVAIMTDNASLLMADAENNVSSVIMLAAAALGSGFSFSISGVAIVGNEDFTTPRSYEQSFTSVGTVFGKARVGVAYSDTGCAYSIGYNLFGGNKIIPPICVSKTYYKLEQTYVIPIQHS